MSYSSVGVDLGSDLAPTFRLSASKTRPPGWFTCRCPWHTEVPGRGRLVGENMRDVTGRYPDSWCVECTAELFDRIVGSTLSGVDRCDVRPLSKWLRHWGYVRAAGALERDGTRLDAKLSVAISRDSEKGARSSSPPARIGLPDVVRCCSQNVAYFSALWERVRQGKRPCPLCGLRHLVLR